MSVKTILITTKRQAALSTIIINKGARGVKGEAGTAGASAYASYVANTSDSPVLTEAEWVNRTQTALNTKANKSNVLELDNIDAFTPTEDYHPSTKKFAEENGGLKGDGTKSPSFADVFVKSGGFIGAKSNNGQKSGFLNVNDYDFVMQRVATPTAYFGFLKIILNRDLTLSWSSNLSVTNNSVDISLKRDAAGVLAQENGVNPQTQLLYNTKSSSSNYERAYWRWQDDTLNIGVEAAGTGVIRNINISLNKGVVNQRTESASDPSLTEYPNNKDSGTHLNTTTGKLYICHNLNGTIYKTELTV